MMIRFDHTKFTLNIDNNIVKINAPMYGIELEIDDIEEIRILDKLPSGLRTNGVGASTYNLGNFSIDDYGKCKLYVYFENQSEYFLNLITSISNQLFSSLNRSCKGVNSFRTNTCAAFTTSPKPPTLLGIIPIICGGTL